ncbi:Butyrophilin subfamily 3 member A3 [Myotis brandtii]|uniref:Butyrophilin subfamily 3 member A3 n=1 Tax=Myotis brandtii TaxID=109478 RepID=S7ML88_MYOBR|nr:Butyrophilin subfamily 3 member A3 [Myotis brandtii]
MSAESMELMWLRSGLRQAVCAYADGKEETEIAEYRGRTSILREDIAEGKAALRIHKVRASDSGIYQCYFQDADFFAKALVELKVAGPFFSCAKPWQVAVGVTLLALFGTLVGAVFFWRQYKKIWALSHEKESERAEKEAAQGKEQQERSAKETLELLLRWTKQQIIADLETMTDPTQLELSAADVILDPDTAHPKLLISEDQRTLNYTDARQSLPDNPRRFQDHYCVLGRENFTSERHFWEVEVGDRKQWQFGVCRENVERKLYPTMTPQNGFWTIAVLTGHEFQARTDPRTKLTIANPPKRVGVFLDYEMGEVSFYDAIDGLHIYTFSQGSFSGPLLPLFRLFSEEPTALTICPAPK